MNAIVALVTPHLRSWDITDNQKNPLPVKEEYVRKLYYQIVECFIDHICGFTRTGQFEADLKNSASGSGS